MTRRETLTEPANIQLRDLSDGSRTALTAFPDPAPQLANVTRQLITYERADGVQLSGTLYLPAGYDKDRDGPLPLLMWAYPAEFTDASVAGQVVDTGNRFVRPGGSSHLFLLTQGYAILDNPSMPIIGVDGAEPNDTYIAQLSASASAAIDAVVDMGVADRDRIAVVQHVEVEHRHTLQGPTLGLAGNRLVELHGTRFDAFHEFDRHLVRFKHLHAERVTRTNAFGMCFVEEVQSPLARV